MIPRAHITEWRSRVFWGDDAQVEEDLVISRVLVEIFSDDGAREHLVIRGGTALNKLHFDSATRYSEDIDLVQLVEGPIGPAANSIQNRFVDILGKPSYRVRESAARMLFRFESEIPPVAQLRLKLEINTREHFTVLPIEMRAFEVDSRWFSGRAEVPTYHIDELMGTKMRGSTSEGRGEISTTCGLPWHGDSLTQTASLPASLPTWRLRVSASLGQSTKRISAPR